MENARIFPVNAPRFEILECNSQLEREFILAMHARAEAKNWYADSWPWEDRVLIAVCHLDETQKYVTRSLRVDYDGMRLAYGDDETHQFVTDLFQSPEATIVAVGTPFEMATIAANWLENPQPKAGLRRIGIAIQKPWWQFW